MLIFQIKRNISSEKRFNDVVTFFWNVPKIWVSQTTVNREKKSIFKKNFDKDIGVINNNLPLSIFIDFHLINRFYWLLSIVFDCWLCWLHLSTRVVWIDDLFKVLLAVFENNISLPGMMFFSLGTEWSDGFPNAILVSPFTVVFVVLGIGWGFINHHQK